MPIFCFLYSLLSAFLSFSSVASKNVSATNGIDLKLIVHLGIFHKNQKKCECEAIKISIDAFCQIAIFEEIDRKDVFLVFYEN